VRVTGISKGSRAVLEAAAAASLTRSYSLEEPGRLISSFWNGHFAVASAEWDRRVVAGAEDPSQPFPAHTAAPTSETSEEVCETAGALSEAIALLVDMHAELEDRKGSLTRRMWNRLETYVEGLSRAPAQPAAPEPTAYEAAMRCKTKCANVYEVRDASGIVVEETRDIESAGKAAIAGGPDWTWRMKPAAPEPSAQKTERLQHARDWMGLDQSRCTTSGRLLSSSPVLRPAAPEPSAERAAKERYLLQCEVAESLRVKLESAESQLAAVHEVAQRAERRVELYPGLKGSTYYAAYLEILALLVRGLTPATSPGADPGEGTEP